MSIMRAAAASTARARRTTSVPASVVITRRLVRSNTRTPDRLLQLAHPGRKRGLADPAGFGGTAEMTMVGDSDEVFQVAQGQAAEYHRSNLSDCSDQSIG
jgi:hypothetical protein